MKRIIKCAFAKILMALIAFISFGNVYATHITGGELSYESVGSNTYKLTLKIYRDCLFGEAGFDDPARISIWSGSGT